jgi:signal transduction histidine kinase
MALIDAAAVQLERLQEQPVEGLAEKRIATIRSAIVRLTNLIERTLSASRIEEGKVRCLLDDCDIEDLLRSAAQRQMAICRHHVRLDLGALPNGIKADAKLLDQVFTNLMGNAVKYSPNAVEILVRAWADQEHVTIEVEDQGVGIPASEQPQIFQRFFRASTSTGIVGTGLGLHLCKHFVEMHGGRLDLRSVEGKGTAISMRLPIDGRAAAIPTQSAG